jgi:hypothetical protein
LASGAPEWLAPVITYSNLADNISPVMPVFSN